MLSTDYHNYAILYKCQNKLFNRIKKEYIWVYHRKPLNPEFNEKDKSEYKRIKTLVVDFLEMNIPDFNFNTSMVNTTQGKTQDVGCIYPSDL